MHREPIGSWRGHTRDDIWLRCTYWGFISRLQSNLGVMVEDGFSYVFNGILFCVVEGLVGQDINTEELRVNVKNVYWHAMPCLVIEHEIVFTNISRNL